LAIEKRISSGFLYRRKIDKLAGGAVIDWNAGPVVERIEKAIAKVNKRGALRVKRKARSLIRQRAYKSGDLYKSVKVSPSKYQHITGKFKGRTYTDWIITAGGDRADYAGHIELGFYHKSATPRSKMKGAKLGKWMYARPYMRPAAANTRKWLRPRMKEAIRRAIR
jgi:hypothetical protein